jgi:hypothetical protein
MSDVVVFKADDGKLAGFGDKGARAWAKFRKRVDGLHRGETLAFQWHEPRSGQHHRLFFAKLGALLDRQEQFDDLDQLRAWVTVGAGYCDFVPGPNGRMCALPKSIAWHKLDEAEFGELHMKVNAFLRTPPAMRFLWPHLDDAKADEMMNAVLDGFGE